jgi:sigma-B regulation protein RsbU (phosphoserine phosphatase)
LAFCNAGHPPAILLSDGVIHQLEAESPAVGMMPEMPYDTKTIPVAKDSRLLVFSDGIFEIEQASGEMWPFEDFNAQIGVELKTGGELIERYLGYARRLGGRDDFSDDFSMLDVRL